MVDLNHLGIDCHKYFLLFPLRILNLFKSSKSRISFSIKQFQWFRLYWSCSTQTNPHFCFLWMNQLNGCVYWFTEWTDKIFYFIPFLRYFDNLFRNLRCSKKSWCKYSPSMIHICDNKPEYKQKISEKFKMRPILLMIYF